MQIFKIEQNSEVWLQFRMGKFMGSNAKDAHPVANNKSERYAGYWTTLSQKMAEAPDGEDPMERGHRLENIALDILAKKYGLDIDKEPGVWVSDLDEDMGISPDGAQIVDVEAGEIPIYAAEVKALESGKHLKFVRKDILAKQRSDYNPIYSVPNEQGAYYRDQAIKYFVVNKKLEKLYYVLYDDRITFDHLVCYVITINRSDVEDLAQEQENREMEALVEMNATIAMLANYKEEQ